MNAFQIGLSTFKWDEAEKKYVARPFNIYLFPYSENYMEINDEQKVLQFTTSCLRFNIKNRFDFNKLFRMGLNYRRLFTEAETIKKMAESKIDEAAARPGGRLGILA